MNYITCITNRTVSSKYIKLLLSTFYIMIHLGSEEIIKDNNLVYNLPHRSLITSVL